MKFIIPSYVFCFYTRIEISPGLKLAGPTNTLTEFRNLIHEL